MQAQIDALTTRVEKLEQMLQAPQNADRHPSTASPRSTQPALTALQEIEKLQTNWKQLRRGLSKTELRQLLGDPASEFRLDRQTLWYYKYPGIGNGSVMLDHGGKVSGWQNPPFR